MKPVIAPSRVILPRRPLLRQHERHWRLAEWIAAHLPPHRAYVEPFGGTASMLLRKPRAYHEVCNDLDGEIVNLFRVLRDQGATLERLLLLTPFAREEFALAAEPCDDCLEQARRTVVRSFMGHDEMVGAFRAAREAGRPPPSRTWATPVDTLQPTIARLRGVVVEQRDPLDVMGAHDSADTLHCVIAPPMAAASDGHEALARVLHGLVGRVMLVGDAGDGVAVNDRLYAGWRRVEPELSTGGRPAGPAIWLSPNCGVEVGAWQTAAHQPADVAV